MARREISVGSLNPAWPNPLKFAEIGDEFTGKVVDVREQHARDFDTNQPEFWPSGDPKMEPVVIMADDNGEKHTWFVQGAEANRALRKALTDADVRNLAVDDSVTIIFAATRPTEAKKGSRAKLSETKLWEVKIDPADED